MDKLIQQKIQEYFKDNESTKQYLDIISTALDRQKPMQNIIDTKSIATIRRKRKEQFKFYTEVHHIIPESIDITYAKYKPNFVILTGEEHFNVHKLLIDMCIDIDHYYSMSTAYGHMSFHNKGWTVTAEEYALGKKLYAESMSIKMTGRQRSEEAKKNMRKPRSEEAKKNMSKAQKGIPKPNISKAQKGIPKPNVSKAQKGIPKPNVSKALTGKKRKPFTQEHLDNLSKSLLSNSEPLECYIIVGGKEIILDKFNSLQEARDKTNGNHSKISQVSNGKQSYSGNYNLETKQYNEINGRNKVPNNKYPSTYRCYWRKIKE